MTKISFILASQLSPEQLLQIIRIELSVIDGNNYGNNKGGNILILYANM